MQTALVSLIKFGREARHWFGLLELWYHTGHSAMVREVRDATSWIFRNPCQWRQLPLGLTPPEVSLTQRNVYSLAKWMCSHSPHLLHWLWHIGVWTQCSSSCKKCLSDKVSPSLLSSVWVWKVFPSLSKEGLMVVGNARWAGQASLCVFLFRSFSFPVFGRSPPQWNIVYLMEMQAPPAEKKGDLVGQTQY